MPIAAITPIAKKARFIRYPATLSRGYISRLQPGRSWREIHLDPGVGAFYNGQFVKGMIQVLIFGSLIALSDHVGPVFGWGAAAFYFYMVIDSHNTAKRKQLGQPAEEWLGLGDFKVGPAVGAGLLITLGALFLLDNLGVQVFQHITRFWPALLIVVGLLMLQKHLKKGTASVAPPQPPSGPKEGPSNIPGPQGM